MKASTCVSERRCENESETLTGATGTLSVDASKATAAY